MNFTNPIWPVDIKEHCCILRMIMLQHQVGLKLNMVPPRVRFWDLCFSSFL